MIQKDLVRCCAEEVIGVIMGEIGDSYSLCLSMCLMIYR
jgi:hypothetical protein